MVGVAVIGVWLLLIAGGIWLTVRVVARVWKRWQTASVATQVLVVIVALSAAMGAFGTLVGLFRASSAVGGEAIEPSQKARLLAEGISEVMNWGALAILVWVPSVTIALVLTRKRKNRSS